IVAVAHEPVVRDHVDEHVDVAGRAAPLARVAAPGQPDPLLVVDPGRDVDAEAPPRGLASAPAALLAGRLGDAPVTAASIADGRAHQLSERRPRDRTKLAGSAAARARLDRRARLGAVAVAARAGLHRVVLDVLRNRGGGLLERDLHADRRVAALHRAAAPAAEQRIAAEEGVEDVRERAEALEARREAARLERLVAVAVVQRAPLGVGQDLVGLGRLLELLLRLRVVLVHVRVELARELAERALDLTLVGVARDAKHVVVVAPHSSYSSLTKCDSSSAACRTDAIARG